MDRSRLIAPDHKRAFRDLLSSVNPLGASRGSMPLPYVPAFLTVALERANPPGLRAGVEHQSFF